jgi:L-threonylcarbamoyladenylate synthase
MKEQIDKAVETLKRGGLILYPTDTVWGIGCDAANADAVNKVYALKRSQDKKGMLVLVDSLDRAARYVNRAPAVAWELFEMADKPLTLILPGAAGVAENLVPEEGTLGIRIPQHDFCHAMLRRFGRAVVSTSANISGKPTPMDFDDISGEIKSGVDFVVDRRYEKGATGKPSSMIVLGAGGEIKIIRE